MQGLLGGASAPAASAASAAPTQAAAAAQAGGHAKVDLVPVMLEVVSQKTGYPTEMLSLEMELEAELGVDSIKRVEILSAMQERVPSLPEVDTATMASLATLQQIVDYMQGLLGKSEAPRHARPVAPLDEAARAQARAAGRSTAHQLLTSVPALDVARYVVEVIETPACGLAMAGLVLAAQIEVVDDGQGVASALVLALESSGWAASVVQAPSGQADGVIDLTGLSPSGADRRAEAALNARAFEVARACAERMSAQGGLYVAVQDTGGDFNLSGGAGQRAWRGGISGLVKTLAQEWPQVSAKVIDVQAQGLEAADVAQLIFDELLYGGAQLEVGLRADGRRLGLVGRAVALSGALCEPVRLGQQDVIVVSGGARGVTATSIIELAALTRASFVLLGRTALQQEDEALASLESEADLKRGMMQLATQRGERLTPKELGARVSRVLADREVRQTLRQIQAAGAQARYESVDVRDVQSLSALLDQVRQQWGPITGLVHGAGVLADAWLTKKTREQFDRVFETKVDGLGVLLEATAQDPLKALCMFSSVAARSGNVGQSDYAMANEVLNKVALSEAAARGVGCVVKSLGWGPWEAGMVTPALKAMFQARGIALIPLQGGAQSFAYELLAMASSVELVLGGAVTAQGLQPPLPEPGARAQVFVHAEHQPFLNSHRIQGRAVLPVVLVMEWFARHASALRPGLQVVAVEQLRVLRGVPLERFEDEGHWLTIEAALVHEEPEVLAMTLLDEAGQRRFSARVRLSDGVVASQQAPRVLGRQASAAAPWDDVAQLYDSQRTLFHGPDFQVIEALSGYDEHGALARLRGTLQTSWAPQAQVTDPALLDGALQVALLWGLRALGAQTLPLGVGCYRRYQGQAHGPVTCQLVPRDVNKQRTLTDMKLVDASGQLVAELEGVEMFMVPSGTA